MELEETPHHHDGGIHNYFEGATINTLVINNGTINKNGSDNYHNDQNVEKHSVTGNQVALALKECENYLWGKTAYSVAFCVCRDVYGMTNVSQFERVLIEQGFDIPTGTINNAMSRNSWLKYNIETWGELNVMDRALKLRDVFREGLKNILLETKKTA